MRTELEAIVRAVHIASPGVLLFAGQTVPLVDHARIGNGVAQRAGGGSGAGQAGDPHDAMRSALKNEIYARCYTTRFPAAAVPPAAAMHADAAIDAAHNAALSAAAGGASRWDRGWRIEHMFPSGQLAVDKFGTARTVWPGEFMTHDGPGIPPRPGSVVSVHAAGESNTMQAGFHFFFSDVLADYQDERDIVRFYWNVTAPGAPVLAGALRRALDAYEIPFRFKLLSSVALYGRRDAGVLFITRRLYRIVAELLADVHREVAPHLDDDTPLFTKRLARGLGFAEDPGNGESFGMDRCAMVAEGIANAWKKGTHSVTGRMREIEAVFARNGVSMERPYLCPGSPDVYQFTS